jgi:Flp pilus assembly protein CpaB
VQFTRKILSTREGTLGFAALAALLAAAAVLMFMQRYKRTVDEGAQPVTVLVAKGAMPKGSSGDLMAQKGLFRATGFKREQVQNGAITDPAGLRGLVAAHDLVKGQQLTTGDFTPPTGDVLSRLGEDERAVTVALDSAHGMIGDVKAGDHVDVFAGFQVEPAEGAGRPRPVLRILLQDVEVLQAPQAKGGGGLVGGAQTQNVVLRVREKDAPQLAFSADNGKLWIALRPQAGATQGKPSIVTLDRLLLGMDPIPVDRFLAKKRDLIAKIYRGDF